MTVTPLTSQSTKAEEAIVLARWVKEAGEQSYLGSFLSKGAVEWLLKQIKDDSNCDLHEWYKAELAGNQALTDKNLKVEAALKLLTEQYNNYAKLSERQTKEAAAELEKERDRLGLVISQERETAGKVLADRHEQERGRRAAERQVEFLQSEVLKLKARVLDLQDKLAAVAS